MTAHNAQGLHCGRSYTTLRKGNKDRELPGRRDARHKRITDHWVSCPIIIFYEDPDIASGDPAVIRLPDRRVCVNATRHPVAKAEAVARPGHPGRQYPDRARAFKTRAIDDPKIDESNAEQRIAIVSAADKYVPGVTWRSETFIGGDFTCRGRMEQAILGVTAQEIIVVVFINGLQNKPEILRDKVHNPADAELTIEGLDYDPNEQGGVELEGFLRSKVCKGLNIADHHVDPFHVYWNHKDSRLDWWSR